MPVLSPRQRLLLVVLTLSWGINWPIMKIGVSGLPPLTFRMLSLWLSIPVLAMAMRCMRVPFAVPRAQWRELFMLMLANMLVWQVLMMLALPLLSSGRAAILGYTMPIFSALLGALFFGDRLRPRGWGGVGAAAVGVLLLLWHEMANLSGRPLGVLLALGAALTWAVGTRLLRQTRLTVPTLTIAFWMTLLTAALLGLLAVVFEHARWSAPTPAIWGAVVYNAVVIFGFAQVLWLTMARGLPPIASTLSVMLIPVIGVFSGAWWLGEVLHWQDWAAVGLMIVALLSVLWPEQQA